MTFTNMELSILGEIGNVSVGGAASTLSDFIDKLVTISIPRTQVSTVEELESKFQSPVYIKIGYTGELEGSNVLMIDQNQGLKFVKPIAAEKLGVELTEWNDLSETILIEVFNIMVGHMSKSMEMIFDKEIRIKPPEFSTNKLEDLFETGRTEKVFLNTFDFKIDGEFTLQLLNVIKKEQARKMIKMIAGDYYL